MKIRADSPALPETTPVLLPVASEQRERQQKITKLRESLSFAQEYADSIIGELGLSLIHI